MSAPARAKNYTSQTSRRSVVRHVDRRVNVPGGGAHTLLLYSIKHTRVYAYVRKNRLHATSQQQHDTFQAGCRATRQLPHQRPRGGSAQTLLLYSINYYKAPVSTHAKKKLHHRSNTKHISTRRGVVHIKSRRGAVRHVNRRVNVSGGRALGLWRLLYDILLYSIL